MFSKYLDPKNDYAFKQVFGTEKNKKILIAFLNDMVVFEKPIVDVTFLKTHQDPEIASKKMSIVDVLCKDQDGTLYIVEMQVADQQGFEKRAQYYAAKAYISQMNSGDPLYQDLKEVIFLAITDFVMFPEKEAFKSDHVILDKDSFEHDLRAFSFTFLELGKFHKTQDQLVSMVDKWAWFFKNAATTSQEDLAALFHEDTAIVEAYEAVNRFHWNEESMMIYEDVLKRDRDHHAILNASMEKGIAKGIAVGRAEGISVGRAKGKAEGRAEGIAEGAHQKALDMAKKLLARGMSSEEVSELTGLEQKDIV